MALLSAVTDAGSLQTAFAVLSFVGKCGVACVFQIVYIYPTELFDSDVRGTTLGVAQGFGRIAAMLAPQASSLSLFALNASFGTLGFACWLFCLGLPETLIARSSPQALLRLSQGQASDDPPHKHQQDHQEPI
eukprot:CAMPEP_0115834470 /NCGR_PEP_ID=MMETSP0287-20121206/3698_1 /TAXON_ID=412157 /ORGANISM="Chrysochromulina rotalis, Strain UIO044" /LENGTH=132 /DNA_ID=CAMNT_0003287903 /DNA_START=59 /DNA_END=457 /DNA_ORIENTATION=-